MESIGTKAHQNNLGKISIDVVRESKKTLRALIFKAHHAVIFAIAQLSCFGAVAKISLYHYMAPRILLAHLS